ncbi:MAG: sugar transferase [bacterium]|nr:sugar transferase [bacterium]
MNLHNRISKKVLLIFLGDTTILFAVLYAALMLRYGSLLTPGIVNKHFIAFSMIFPVWLITFGAFGFYDLRMLKNEKVFLYRLLRVMLINAVLAIIIFYLFPFTIEPRRNLFIIATLATAAIFIWRYLFNLLIIRAAINRVIFIGFNEEMVRLAGFLLQHPQLGHKPVAFSSGHTQPLILPADMAHIPLNHDNMARAIRDTKPDIVVISPEMKGNKMTVNVLLSLIPSGIAVAEFPAFHEAMTGKIPLSLIEEVWFLENLIGIKKRSYEFLKRILDIVLACIIGIISLLLLPFIALAIKLDSAGPVLFRQTRVGRHGKPFTLVKFRSMVANAESLSGFKVHGQQDPRHTRIGALMRNTYMDELPQIINIMRGEMSFIGPRPERPEYVQDLKQKIPFYETRLLVPPGITGWAQVNMENDASVEDAPEKMQYDLYYIKNRTFILDLLITLRTLFTIVQRQGR